MDLSRKVFPNSLTQVLFWNYVVATLTLLLLNSMTAYRWAFWTIWGECICDDLMGFWNIDEEDQASAAEDTSSTEDESEVNQHECMGTLSEIN